MRRSITECGAEQSRRGKRRYGPNVVPGRPAGHVAGPQARAVGVGRCDRCKRLIPGHVEHNRHQQGADQIEHAAGEQVNDTRFVPPHQSGDQGKNASRPRPKESYHKPWIQHRDVDGLHGGNTLAAGKTSEGLHHEGGKGKEDAGYQPAAECHKKCQREEPLINRCHKASCKLPLGLS